MTLIAFVSADDGVTPVVVESGFVQSLAPLVLLPPGVLAGTRMQLITAGPPVDVVGNLAAVVAALAGGPLPGGFGSQFGTPAGGDFTTNSGVYVAVPNTGYSPTEACQVIVIPTAIMEVSGLPLRTFNTVLKNGAPIGKELIANYTLPAQPSAEFTALIADAAIPGDLYELGFKVSPGAGVNTGTIRGPRLTAWKVG
jgi:hypothetical protein